MDLLIAVDEMSRVAGHPERDSLAQFGEMRREILPVPEDSEHNRSARRRSEQACQLGTAPVVNRTIRPIGVHKDEYPARGIVHDGIGKHRLRRNRDAKGG